MFLLEQNGAAAMAAAVAGATGPKGAPALASPSTITAQQSAAAVAIAAALNQVGID